MNIVITGGGRGIGKATVKKFLSEGCKVFFTCKTERSLQQLTDEFQSKHLFGINLDVSKRTNAIRFENFVSDNCNSINMLVNNIGIFLPGNVDDEHVENLQKMVDVNLFSALYVTQSFLPLLKKDKATSRIVNINSVAGLDAYPNGGFYSISKFAMKGFSINLRESLKKETIKVSDIYPGAVLTDSWSGSGLDKSKFIKASDIAQTIWHISQLSNRANCDEIIMKNDPFKE